MDGNRKEIFKKEINSQFGFVENSGSFFVFVEQGAAQPKKPVCRTTKNE